VSGVEIRRHRTDRTTLGDTTTMQATLIEAAEQLDAAAAVTDDASLRSGVERGVPASDRAAVRSGDPV
jgi:hypothetical protein